MRMDIGSYVWLRSMRLIDPEQFGTASSKSAHVTNHVA